MCQHYMNLTLGKQGILMLPREWLLARLDLLLELALASDDYYEYAQISGVLNQVDHGAHQRFLELCRRHENKEIRELGD